MKTISEKYDLFIAKICHFFEGSVVQVSSFILYKIMVDTIYFLYIGRTAGFGVEIKLINVLSSYICVGLFSYFICIYSEEKRASSFLLLIINMIYFIPITSYCSLGPGSTSFLFFAIIYWGILSFLQIKVPVVTFKRKVINIRYCFFYLIIISVAILTIYLSVKYTGFRIITDLLDVYKYRAEASTYNLPRWLVYLQNFSTVLIPLLILLSFSKRRYIFAIVSCFLLLLNFSFAGHKIVLFMGILLVMGYIFWKNEMMSLVIPGGILVGIIAILEERILQHSYIISFFFRREGYVLAQLSDQYYRFFNNNPVDIFRGTFLGKIGFDSPYSIPIPYVIGNNYSTQTVSCNNGLLADVWSHIGIIGLIVMPVIIIVCFRLFDMVTDGLEMRYVVGMGIYYAVCFVDSGWSIVLLTHGFLIVCMMFFLFPRVNRIKKGGKNEGYSFINKRY